MHFFGDFRPKRSILGNFFGGGVPNLPLKTETFSAQGTPSNPGSSYYPFNYYSSFFLSSPYMFVLIPTRNRLSIAERQCQQKMFMIKTL